MLVGKTYNVYVYLNFVRNELRRFTKLYDRYKKQTSKANVLVLDLVKLID